MGAFVCSTPGCGKISSQRKCESCRVRRQPRERRANEDVRRRYRTARWERLRQRVLERDGHLCQECLRNGIVRQGKEIDHVRKAMDDLSQFWQAENLQTLCKRCHGQKTARGE